MDTTPQTVRQLLAKSSDPDVKEVANDPKLLKIISDQLSRGLALAEEGIGVIKEGLTSKGGQAAIFAGKQLTTTLKLAGKGASPSALTALVVQKFLLTGKIVSENDLAKCSIAVGFLATEGVIAAAAGVPTGGTATLVMGASLVSNAYTVYDSCKKVKF